MKEKTMEENAKNEQIVKLNEEQLQAITGGTGGRVSNFYHAPKDPDQYDEHMLIAQHKKEAEQALSDAYNYRIAGSKKEANKSLKDAAMHYDMIRHIDNNMRKESSRGLSQN
jgi:hypothetical protein